MRVVGDQQTVPDCGGRERDSGVFKSIWYQLSVKSTTCSRFWICPNHPHPTSVAFHVARVNIKQFFIRVWNYRELCSQLVWEITPIIAKKKFKLWVKFETKWVLFRCLQIILSKKWDSYAEILHHSRFRGNLHVYTCSITEVPSTSNAK